jgi:hypothetical protein
MEFVTRRWKPFILIEEGKISRPYYELATLTVLNERLKSGDVTVEGSRRWTDFEDYLIPRETWEAERTVEFFTVNISNNHTRKAYLNATKRFSEWCQAHGVDQLADVQPFHVAAFLKDLEKEFPLPTVKHLAALRMLFDWLVVGQIMDTNPAHAVRGPKYVVKKGKTPVLTPQEARALLDSIAVVRAPAECSTEPAPPA